MSESTAAYYKILAWHHYDTEFLSYVGRHEFVGMAAEGVDEVYQKELDYSIARARALNAYFVE